MSEHFHYHYDCRKARDAGISAVPYMDFCRYLPQDVRHLGSECYTYESWIFRTSGPLDYKSLPKHITEFTPNFKFLCERDDYNVDASLQVRIDEAKGSI